MLLTPHPLPSHGIPLRACTPTPIHPLFILVSGGGHVILSSRSQKFRNIFEAPVARASSPRRSVFGLTPTADNTGPLLLFRATLARVGKVLLMAAPRPGVYLSIASTRASVSCLRCFPIVLADLLVSLLVGWPSPQVVGTVVGPHL